MWRRLTELLRWACTALLCASSATALAALVAEYKFEETNYSGTAGEVIDSSGNGHHGRMVRSSGALAYPSSTASGKTCRGVQIPANTNSDIQAFDTGIDINTIGDRGTITFWYKSVNTGSTTDRALLDATSASGIVFNLNRHHHDPADLEARSTDDGGDTDYELGTNAVPEATWTHIALTWNGGGVMTIYANGANEGTETIDAFLHANTGTLYIGDNRSSFSPVMYSANGTIDQVRIYNTELSAAQINTDKAATPACSDLHHLELTTASSSVAASTGLVFTIKACANAACSTLYTGGVTGNLSITGVTPTYTTGQAFSIAAGSSSTTETASMTAGTATAALTSPSPTPVQTPTIYCGMGVAAASGNSCAITVTPPLHHLELTTASSSATAGNNVTFTVKACADASCSSLYTSGVTGTLAISGVTPTFPSGAAFTVAAGSATTTLTASMTAGTATASITSPSPTPTNSPALFCGMGVAAASGNSCSIAVNAALHHLELTTASGSATAGSNVTFTVKACANSTCSSLYTSGVTGTLAISGVTPTFPSGAAFTVAAGSATTTVTASMTAGTATASITSPSPTPTNSPALFCGMGVAAASGNSCSLSVNPALHHLEVTTTSATVTAGTNVVFTVRACVDASCSSLYTLGVSGTLAISGVTPTFPSGAAFAIPAASSSTTVTASMTVGTATASITSPSPTPSNSPALFCGMGVAAASGNVCTLTVNPALHHLEITAPSASAVAGANVTFTVRACVDASCSTLYTYGASGILSITGVTPAYPSGAAISIGSGNASTTVVANMSPAGTATVSMGSLSPTPTNTPTVFCGMGVAAASGNSCNLTITPALHHMEVTTSSNSGLTCTNPVTYTIKACGDAACSTLYTNGVTGNLSLTGATVNYTAAFTVASGASSTATNAYITTAGVVTAALSGLTPTPAGSPAVYCGMGSAAASGGSCAFTVADAGFHFTVPHHVSEVQQTITVSALRATGAPTVCAPLFTSSKAVNFKCTYLNPNSGAGRPVRVNGTALNAGGSLGASCDGTGRSITLPFNGSGVASPVTVQYADVGQVKLTASYSASSGNDSGLVMSGESTFIAAPASFSIGSITAAPIKAGSNFSATVTALNWAGSATPNFGREAAPEGATLTFAKYRPAGGAAGVFSGGTMAGGSFSSGVATNTGLSWTEVGTGDLTASLTSASYLGSGMTATGNTGSTGAVGPFTPHHFSVSPSNACGAFTYSGQPFGVSITALNAAGDTTTNFDGSGTVLTGTYPQGVTLAATTNGGMGTLSNTTISGSSFTLGVAAVSASSTSPSFAFTTKQTVPTSVAFQAADALYTSITSSGYTEGSVALRSGRLKMSNAFGSEKSNLSLPVQAQYWGGNSWVINSADSCTVVPASAIGRSNYLNSRGEATSSWTTTASALTISGGSGKLTLTAPSPSGATSLGSVDIAFNLGSTATDNACLSSHATTTGAAMSWLRGTNANVTAACPSSLIDPSARATFGVRAPHTHKIVHRRELF